MMDIHHEGATDGASEAHDPETALIEHLEVRGDSIKVRFNREFARAYLRDDFYVEYEGIEELSQLDWSILSLPALLNVLPIVWATGREYRVGSIDAELWDSLEEMRQGYAKMLPGTPWKGDIHPDQVVTSNRRDLGESDGRMAILFSGGLDSTFTSLAHATAEQSLISVWGTDIALENHEGWREMRRAVESFATVHDRRPLFVRSNIRAFLDESTLNELFPEIRNWWQQVQHGPGLVGLVAPIAILLDYPKVIFSSGRMVSDQYTVGASADLEGRLRWAGARAIHFGENLTRHEKLRRVVSLYGDASLPRPRFRVCFMYPYGSGGNCGKCEKCLRTMTGLIVEGADPETYGFDVSTEVALRRVRRRFSARLMVFGEGPLRYWSEIQNRGVDLHASAKSELEPGVRNFLSWFVSFDLERYRWQWERIGRLRAYGIRLMRRSPAFTRWVLRSMAAVRRIRSRTETNIRGDRLPPGS